MPRLLRLLALAVALLAASHADAQGRPPNIVLLIGDDLGWPYAGFMGDPLVQTPNLDALAARGTTFVQAQSPSSVCQPALRALLAGIHSQQWDRQKTTLEAVLGPMPWRNEVQYYRTVPRELGRRGYLSWEGGKLWEGTFATAGFTHGLATSIGPDLFSSVGEDFGRDGWTEGTAMTPLESFLDEAGGKPFFLWVAPMLPHVPYDAPPEFTALYGSLGLDPRLARYYANTSWLDAVLGAVLAALDARGLRDDTLVVFVSDNGKDATQDIAGAGQGKGTLYEMGFRQPLILSWPGHVPQGVLRDDLVSSLDVPPTLLDYAGADAIADGPGRSLRDAVENGTPVGRDRLVSAFRGRTPDTQGAWVRTPSWRYLTALDGREELYAIDVDPYEQVNVAPLHPNLLPGFRADVQDWKTSLAAGRAQLDVSGRLTDPSGAPLAGENLELSGRSVAGERIRLRTLTSARGDFLFESVPLGAYGLKSRRVSAALSFRNARGRIPVKLAPGNLDVHLPVHGLQAATPRTAGDAVLRGRVLDGAGQPVAGATVALRGPRVSLAVRTGSDGAYRVDSLPSGDYLLLALATTPRRKATAGVTIAAGSDRVLDFTLS